MKPITQKFPMFSKDDASYLPTVTHFYEHRAETEARDLPGLYRRIPGLKNLAWDEDLEYTMQKAAGLLSSVTSGEGLVCKFTGPGTLYIHTTKYSAVRKKEEKTGCLGAIFDFAI